MQSPRKAWRERALRSQSSRVVREIERFLAGDMVDAFSARGRWVPAWAWISLLTHAPAEVLQAHAGRGVGPKLRGQLDPAWSGAVALLCRELLLVADQTGNSVEDLQRDVLLDVELGWDERSDGRRSTGPVNLVEEVLRALEHYRRSADRRH